MTASTVAGSSSVTRRRFGIPALFTSTSMPPRSSLRLPGERLDPVEVGEVDGPHPRPGRVLLHLGQHLARAVLAPGADADRRARLRRSRSPGRRRSPSTRRSPTRACLRPNSPCVEATPRRVGSLTSALGSAPITLRPCPSDRTTFASTARRDRHRRGRRHRPGHRDGARPVRRRRRGLRPGRREPGHVPRRDRAARAAARCPASSTSATASRSRRWLGDVAAALHRRRHPREQRRRRLPGRLPRRERQGPGRAHPRELHQRRVVRPRRRAADAGGRRVDRQRHVDRGPPGRPRLRGLQRDEGRPGEPDPVPGARARAAPHPGELRRARRHPDARHRRRDGGAHAAPARRPSRRRRRGDRVPGQPRRSPASSPARRSTSTAATARPAVGTASPTAPTSRERPGPRTRA